MYQTLAHVGVPGSCFLETPAESPSVPQTWSVIEDVCPYHVLEMIPYVKDPHPHKHGQSAPKIELGIDWVCTQVKNGLNCCGLEGL